MIYDNLKFGDEFLGGVRVPLKVLGPTGFHDAWYFLQPRDGGGRVVEDLGSLRLNIVYTEDHVFSSHCYTALRELLLLSASVQVSYGCSASLQVSYSRSASVQVSYGCSASVQVSYGRSASVQVSYGRSASVQVSYGRSASVQVSYGRSASVQVSYGRSASVQVSYGRSASVQVSYGRSASVQVSYGRSASVQPVSASAAHILGEVCREKQEAAVPLVRLFLHGGQILPFLRAIAHAEVNRTQDPNTIFRGNSLTSKCIDESMKLAGMHYLQVTLKPLIDEEGQDLTPVQEETHQGNGSFLFLPTHFP
ncbi:hypothetical protein CRUP_017426 [Coryphaenoides rupestris]|nr:hypothetical protein CRUP_017426 [Coryphaenoides rupestris]